MITAETMLQGTQASRSNALMPAIFNDVEPLEFQNVVSTECSDYVLDHLVVKGVGRPSNQSMSQWYALYVRAGYEKAKPEHFKQREDGTPGCMLEWSETEQAYIDGDIVMMVALKSVELGYQKAAYIRANYPSWNADQRKQMLASGQLGKSASRAAVLDAVDRTPAGENTNRTNGPKVTSRTVRAGK